MIVALQPTLDAAMTKEAQVDMIAQSITEAPSLSIDTSNYSVKMNAAPQINELN